jgi:hypothetical protein
LGETRSLSRRKTLPCFKFRFVSCPQPLGEIFQNNRCVTGIAFLGLEHPHTATSDDPYWSAQGKAYASIGQALARGEMTREEAIVAPSNQLHQLHRLSDFRLSDALFKSAHVSCGCSLNSACSFERPCSLFQLCASHSADSIFRFKIVHRSLPLRSKTHEPIRAQISSERVEG